MQVSCTLPCTINRGRYGTTDDSGHTHAAECRWIMWTWELTPPIRARGYGNKQTPKGALSAKGKLFRVCRSAAKRSRSHPSRRWNAKSKQTPRRASSAKGQLSYRMYHCTRKHKPHPPPSLATGHRNKKTSQVAKGQPFRIHLSTGNRYVPGTIRTGTVHRGAADWVRDYWYASRTVLYTW